MKTKTSSDSSKQEKQEKQLLAEIFDGDYDRDNMLSLLMYIKLAKEARSLGVFVDYLGHMYCLAPSAIQFL